MFLAGTGEALPNRILREGILTSPRVDRLSDPAELFYRRLMSRLDDHGRAEANVALLISGCYPLRFKRVKAASIEKWLEECRKAGLLVVYTVSGKRYLQYLDWRQQTRSDSKFPAPDKQLIADAQQMPANAHLGVVVGVVVSEGVGEGAARKRAAHAHKTPLPENFNVSDRVRAWALEKGHGHLEERLEHFVSRCRAKGYTYVDWDEGFMGAIRDNWAKLNGDATEENNSTCCAEVDGHRCGQPGIFGHGKKWYCREHEA